jgi:formamidopyrimidine-DNA glycosylase
MAKQKDRSELESLRATNRSLRKQVTHLKKELARKEKRAHQYHDLEERQKEEDIDKNLTVFTKPICPACNGDIETSELGNRLLTRCTQCKWRKSSKI